MTELDLAYLAGFFDGEGCAGIKRTYGSRGRSEPSNHMAYCTISQTRPAVLIAIHDEFGGSLRFNQKCGKNGIWVWWCVGKIARDFLATIYPLLRIKREEVRLVLDAFSVLVRDKKPGVPPALRAHREANMQQIKALRM